MNTYNDVFRTSKNTIYHEASVDSREHPGSRETFAIGMSANLCLHLWIATPLDLVFSKPDGMNFQDLQECVEAYEFQFAKVLLCQFRVTVFLHPVLRATRNSRFMAQWGCRHWTGALHFQDLSPTEKSYGLWGQHAMRRLFSWRLHISIEGS